MNNTILSLRSENGTTWQVQGENKDSLEILLLEKLKAEYDYSESPEYKDLVDSAIVVVENGIRLHNWLHDKNDTYSKYDLTHGKFELRYIEPVVEEMD